MNRWLASLAVLAAVFALSCGGGDGGGDAVSIADRVLRIGEGVGTEVEIFEGEVPDNLDSLLNPDDSSDEPTELPPLPDSKLVGSARVGRVDGLQTFFIMYELAESETTVGEAARGLFDETPWQIVGGQSSEGVTAYRFQSTRSGDLVGTVVVQPLPTSDSFEVTVSRGGDEETLKLSRHAFTPALGAELETREGGVVVSKLGAGEGANAGLEEGDRIVRIGDEDVDSIESIGAALRALSQDGDPVTSVIYILQISPSDPITSPFVAPEARQIPRTFPAPFLVRDEATPIAVEWSVDPSGSAYQLLFLSDETVTAVAEDYRNILRANNLQIVSDDAQGSATSIEFADGNNQIVGTIAIDTFAEDDSFTEATIQVQTAPGFSGTPSAPTPVPGTSPTATPAGAQPTRTATP